MNHVDAQLFDLQPIVRRSHFLATQSAILPSLPRLTMSMVCVGLDSSLHSPCWPLLRPAPKQRVRTTPNHSEVFSPIDWDDKGVLEYLSHLHVAFPMGRQDIYEPKAVTVALHPLLQVSVT